MERAGIYHTGIAKGAHHKGPRAAGNKSLISYRAGHGVVGYNGYIPSTESIPIPIKEGPAFRAGIESDKETAQVGWEFPESASSLSTYQATVSNGTIAKRRPRPATAPVILPPRGPVSPDNEISGVLESQDDLCTLPNAKFLGKSMFKTSFLLPSENGRLQKDILMPPSTGALRKRPAFMSGTTYSSTIENSMEIMNGQGWMEEKHRKLLGKENTQFGSKWKEVVYQRQPPPSSYQTDFGAFGEGRAGKLPDHALGISENGTTAHLFEGTCKAFARMPGYTAFMPESGANQHACAHATDHAHADPKNCRLFTLHQHRLNIPGTGIFQARDAANLKAPPKGRVGTASHFNNAYVSDPENLKILAHARSLEKFHGAVNGTASFFQAGSLSVSENGVKNAEGYYRLLRPLEGIPRVLIPSKTTASGYMFGCYREAV